MQKVLRNSTVLMNTHAQKHVHFPTLAVRVLMVETETATLWHIINTHCSAGDDETNCSCVSMCVGVEVVYDGSSTV